MPARKAPYLAWRIVLTIGILTTLPPSADTFGVGASRLLVQQSQQDTGPVPEAVTLSFTVHGKDGQFIKDLPQEEFRIFEDGKEQSITSFSRSDPRPLSLGLLMQWSGQRRNTLPYAEIDAAARFFQSLIGRNDVGFAARFSESVKLITDFTNDPAEIERSLQRARQDQLYGPSALFDAIIWVCGQKLLTKPGRRVLVLVADGHDNGSRKQISNAIESALRAETTIYVVSLVYVDPSLTGAYLRSVAQQAQVLAEETGGNAVFVRNRKDLPAAFSQISEELRNQHILVYYSTNTGHEGKFRRIEIKTTDKDLHILTRDGYYAPKN